MAIAVGDFFYQLKLVYDIGQAGAVGTLVCDYTGDHARDALPELGVGALYTIVKLAYFNITDFDFVDRTTRSILAFGENFWQLFVERRNQPTKFNKSFLSVQIVVSVLHLNQNELAIRCSA